VLNQFPYRRKKGAVLCRTEQTKNAVVTTGLLADLVPTIHVDNLRISANGLGLPTSGDEPGPEGAVRSCRPPAHFLERLGGPTPMAAHGLAGVHARTVSPAGGLLVLPGEALLCAFSGLLW